jgi:hypothetical protein
VLLAYLTVTTGFSAVLLHDLLESVVITQFSSFVAVLADIAAAFRLGVDFSRWELWKLWRALG